MSGGSRAGVVVVVVVVAWLCVAPVAGMASGYASTGSQNAGETVVTEFSAPESVTLHRNFTVHVTVNNTRDAAVEQTVRVQRSRDRLWSTVATRNVTVPANTNATVAVNATVHVGQPGDRVRLRVGDLDPQTVDLHENSVVQGPTHDGPPVADDSLAQGENTTVRMGLLSDFESGEYVVRFEGGQYQTGATYTESVTVGSGEMASVTAYPTFDAGGQHAVTGSGELLGFVNVSSPNVSITGVESLPGEVYEGGEHSLNVTVANTGSGTESFAVTTSHTPSGATAAQRADTRVVTLAAGETRTVERTVRFYERGDQTVAVNGGHAQNVSVVAPVSVVDYEVTAAADYTDQYVNVTATLRNGRPTPATADVQFALWNDSDGGDGQVSETLQLNDTERVTVAGDSTDTVTHSWFVTVPATYDVAVADRPAQRVDVAANPIRANLTSPAGDVPLGEPVDVELALQNDGETATHRYVSMGEQAVDLRNVSLSPGASTTEAFTVTPRTRGELQVTLAQNRSVTTALTVPTPNLTVTATTWPSGPVPPGARPRLRFDFENAGGTDEWYSVPAAIEHDSFDGVREEWSVFESVTANSTTSHEEPWEAGQPGNYTVTAQGEQVATVTVSKPLVTERATLSNATVAAGESVTFEGSYRNPTEYTQYAWVTVPGVGDEIGFSVDANASRTITRTWQFQRAGTYEVFVNGERLVVTVEANETTGSDGTTDDGSGSTDDTSEPTDGETDETTDSDSGTDSGGGTDTSGGGPSTGGASSGEETTLDDTTGDSSTDETATNDTLTNETTATRTNGTATNETTSTTTTGSSSTTTATTAASATTAATGAGTGTAAANATSDEAAANATTAPAATTGGTESSPETEQGAPASSSAGTPGFGVVAAVVALVASGALRARTE